MAGDIMVLCCGTQRALGRMELGRSGFSSQTDAEVCPPPALFSLKPLKSLRAMGAVIQGVSSLHQAGFPYWRKQSSLSTSWRPPMPPERWLTQTERPCQTSTTMACTCCTRSTAPGEKAQRRSVPGGRGAWRA